MNHALERSDFVRPILLALALTVAGELFYFVVWGMILFPVGSIAAKFAWTMTCALAMGLSIGSLVGIAVVGRGVSSTAAAIVAGAIYAAILSYCSILCAEIDQVFDFFGGSSEPSLFIWSGIIPAIVTAPIYGWLLFSETGSRFMNWKSS